MDRGGGTPQEPLRGDEGRRGDPEPWSGQGAWTGGDGLTGREMRMRRVGGVLACGCAGSAGFWRADAPGRRGFGVRMRRVGAQTCRRDCTIRKRFATYAVSVNDAVAAGLAPVPWKSLNAADWFTNTLPVRFSDSATPASRAADLMRSITDAEVL